MAIAYASFTPCTRPSARAADATGSSATRAAIEMNDSEYPVMAAIARLLSPGFSSLALTTATTSSAGVRPFRALFAAIIPSTWRPGGGAWATTA